MKELISRLKANKRIFFLLLLPLSYLIVTLVRGNEELAEHLFARGIYKWTAGIWGRITGIVPFSIMEVSLILLPIVAIVLCIRFILSLAKSIKTKNREFSSLCIRGALNVACIASILVFWFVLFGGVNYYRYPFAAYSGLEVRESSVDELYQVTLNLARKAVILRESLRKAGTNETTEGVISFGNDTFHDIGNKVQTAFIYTSQTYPTLGGTYGGPKPILFSRFMSKMEITGIFWPFTVEANINADAPAYSIPATMAHELAHQRGYMREDEANFIAYLVCKESEDLLLQYSGTMLALSYASGQLYKYDTQAYYSVQDIYHTGMTNDLRAEYYYWKQFENTVISTVSNKMNDTYLKANNQKDGVQSYGRMVDLLLAEYRKELGE